MAGGGRLWGKRGTLSFHVGKLESSRAGGKDSPGKFNFNWAEEIAFCSLHDAILSSPYCTAHRVK